MTLLECINRILRLSALIRGDTDEVDSLADIQHSAAISLAQIAIQSDLAELVSDRLIPKERSTSGSITLVAATRTYDLATDFIRFFGVPSFYNAANNRRIYEYPGGVKMLQQQIYTYESDQGEPNWWYWEDGDTTYKKIGLYQVPSTSGTLTYDYESSVMISLADDELPFHNTEEDYAFTDMAARRFKFLFEDVKNEADIIRILEADRTYRNAKARLMNFLRGRNSNPHYGCMFQ